MPAFHKENIQYTTKRTMDLTDEELSECSELFGSFYGKYSEDSRLRPGEQIRMPVSYYRRNYCKPYFFVAVAREKGRLVGQAFYLRKDYKAQGFGVMTWVLQLVVDDRYRRQGIASTLLRSIWGFSDDYAWGLATTNPCTVKTLESATFRKCKPQAICEQIRAIQVMGEDISFARNAAYAVTSDISQIDTDFYVDNHAFLKDDTCEKQLGKLRKGHEWLAFTFSGQEIDDALYQKHFEDAIDFSEAKLKEAYDRMNLSQHKWTEGTENEVAFIEKFGSNDTILDLGCGQGRHAIRLAQDGARVMAVDFSEKNIEMARRTAEERLVNPSQCTFVREDARTFWRHSTYDKVICLYDVIGSFPEEEDNLNIIRTAYHHLKKGGYFILSVMNMELTERIVPSARKQKVRENPTLLRKLPPSRTMQSSGDVFHPDYLAIDTGTGLVYRKEQFEDDDNLAAEYVIRDRRYRMEELKQILIEQGFEVVDERFVRAGHFDEKLGNVDEHAKEICLVGRKRI